MIAEHPSQVQLDLGEGVGANAPGAQVVVERS
jgi:hypothetical protein